MYVSLIQFTDQEVRKVKDTIKRSEAAMAEAEKMGMKIIQPLPMIGAYDVVVLNGKRQDLHHARLHKGRDGKIDQIGAIIGGLPRRPLRLTLRKR